MFKICTFFMQQVAPEFISAGFVLCFINTSPYGVNRVIAIFLCFVAPEKHGFNFKMSKSLKTTLELKSCFSQALLNSSKNDFDKTCSMSL